MGGFSFQKKMLSGVLKMRKCVIEKIEVEKEWEANSDLITASALGQRAEVSTPRCMISSSDE